MSSTYQWIIEDTDNKGFTARVVIDLEDDDGEETHYATGHRCHTSENEPSPHEMSQQQQQQQVQWETMSEGKTSLSHRSHRSGGSKTRKAGQPQQRSSGSGGGSHHSSAGSGGEGSAGRRRRGYARRPAWMTTSVYGAERLDDSEEEQDMSPASVARRKACAAATSSAALLISSASPPNATPSSCPLGGTMGRKRGDAPCGGGVRNHAVPQSCEEACISGDEADEEREGVNQEEGEAPEPVHHSQLVNSFGCPEKEKKKDWPRQSGHEPTCNGDAEDGDDKGEWDETTPLGVPPHHHDDGRSSPVTATFYFTPNTNAEARASAEEAMWGDGLLYPAYGFGAPVTPSQQLPARDDGHRPPAPAPAPAPAGPRYNKKLRKKVLRKQLEEEHQSREGDRGEHLSFSAAVEALAMRAQKKLHHMPDYDSDQELRWQQQQQQQQQQQEECDLASSAVDTDSCSSPGDSPYKWETAAMGGAVDSSDEDGSAPRRSWDFSSSSETDFERYQRSTLHQQRDHLKGSGSVGATPAVQEPPSVHGTGDTSGFFISPIHQLVAESSSPWGQGCGPGIHSTDEPPPFVFLGHGGLKSQPTSAALAARHKHAASSREGGEAVATSSRRRTISNGGSILRVPVGVELPTPAAHAGARRRKAVPVDEVARAAPGYDREMEKAMEEGLVDNLSSVLAHHHHTRRKDRGGSIANATAAAGARGEVAAHGSFSSVHRPRAVTQPVTAGRKRRLDDEVSSIRDSSEEDGSRSFSSSSSSLSSECGSSSSSSDISGTNNRARGKKKRRDDPYSGFTSEERQVMRRLKRRRNRRRRLERATQECGGSQVLGPCPSPSIAPSLELLPSSQADMREDLLESFLMDTKLHEDDFKLF